MKTRQLSRSLVATAAVGVLLVLTLGLAVVAGSAQSMVPESLRAEHIFSSDLLHQGEAASGLLTIHNRSDQPVTLDGLGIELAEGLAYVGPALGSDVVALATTDGSTLRWTGPFDVAAGETLTLRYWVVAADAAPGQGETQANISLAGKTLALDGSALELLPAPDDSVIATAPDLDLSAAPEAVRDVSVTKTAEPAEIPPGNAVVFDVEFYNDGNSAQALDTITDLLPVPFEYIGLAPGSEVGVEPVDPQAPEIVWQGSFSVPSKGTLILRYWAWVPIETEASETPYVNTVTASSGSDTTDPAMGNVTVIGPNIEVTKSVSPQEVLSAEYVTYTVTLENTGNGAGVVDLISDTLPLGFEFRGMLSGGTITAPPIGTTGTIAWEGPFAMASGAQETLIYQARTSMASGLETQVNEVVVFYDGKTSAPATAAVTVKPRLTYVPLALKNYTAPYFVASKTVAPTEVDVSSANAEVVYTVEFTNPGDDPGLLDTVYDQLPPGFSYVQMESGSPPTDVGLDGLLVWDLDFPETGPDETLTLSYRVRVAQGTEPGTYDNQATATTLVGRAPEGPALATVRVKDPILLWEDFESGTDDWEPFLNYWRLEPEQWYLESNGGFDGSKGIRHTYWLGKPDPDRGAHDAIYMYQGAGSDDWTDYRLETMIRADGAGVQGLWFRGKYVPSDLSGHHVEGYYVTWQSYRSRVVLWSLSDSGEWAYHFADPHDIAIGNYIKDLERYQWYRLAVEVRGSNIKVFVSEAPYTSEYKVIDANDSTFGTGTVGFVGYKMEDTGFDNVLVTPLHLIPTAVPGELVAATERDSESDRLFMTSRARSRVALLGLMGVLFAGLALRLVYLLRASPFVDEYSTLLAIQGILLRGAPYLPTGFFYGQDILYSYLATGAALLWPDDLAGVRILSLLASLVAIALTYRIGHRLFSIKAGLLASAFLALSPAAVLWGARGRAYALELLLALVAFWLFYCGVEQERPWWRRLGLVALVAAVFTHPESALMLPALALAVLVLRGVRWWLRLDRVLEFALAGAAMVGRYLLQNVFARGDLGGFDTISDARSVFGLLVNWQGGLETMGSFLFAGPMLPATVLALLAVLVLGVFPKGDPRAYPVRFLAITLGTIVLQMALLIGGTWQSTRYLLFAAPLLFLLAGAGLQVLASWLTPRLPRAAATAALAVVVVVALLPSLPAAVRAANTTEIAYDVALDYVDANWTPGDRLATLAPAAAWIGLGRVDYFVLGKDYEEFVWQKDGQWYDRWTGAPLIRTEAELEAALDEVEATGSTLWLVTDEPRLLRRYDADMLQTIWDRMILAHAEARGQVFRSQPAPSYAVETNIPRRETFAGQLALIAYAIGQPSQAGAPPDGALVAAPGQSLPLRLDWQALSPLARTYTVFVHLVSPDGTSYTQSDGLPLGGLYPMHLWQPGMRYPDLRTLDLPPDLPPGRYRIELGLYDLATGDRLTVSEGPGQLPGDTLILDYVTVPGARKPAEPAIPLKGELGGAIRLLGFSPEFVAQDVSPGDKLAMTLHWETVAPTNKADTLFVHALGADGTVLTQHDGQPLGGFYPTAFWDSDEQVEERILLDIPDDAPPGAYQLVAGFYLLATGDRLPSTGAGEGLGDALLLSEIQWLVDMETHRDLDASETGSEIAGIGNRDAINTRRLGHAWAEGMILLAILIAAGWLRWTHVQDASLHVDEYITLRAARQILDRGLPLLPTGNFYSHGLLLSYAEAGIMALTGFDPVAARLPVLIASLFGVLLTWWLGRRWFSPPVGLLAAALLAFTPEAVIWGGRARMYGPLQLFVLLAVFFYWRGLSRGGRLKDSVLFTLGFLAAQFLHAETMILLPVFILIAIGASWPDLRREGARAVLHRWWRTGLIGAWFVSGLGVLAEIWFRRLGPPMVSRLSEGVYGPSTRSYVQIALDWAGIQKTLEPILTSPLILGMIGCLLIGLVYWFFRRRKSGTPFCPKGWRPPLVYLVAILAITLPVLLFVADPSWKSPRYLFMLLPVFYLVLSACLLAVVRQFRIGRQREWLVLGVALICVVVGSWQAARAAASEDIAGYDHAFDYLAEQWQPGDAVMTFVPQAAILHLGDVDYLSVPTDYRGFAVQQETRWFEGWDSIIMVDSPVGVDGALAAQDRLWFVVDEGRFHTRFAPGFAQAIWDSMDLVWRDSQVMIFRSADPLPPEDPQPVQVLFGDQIALEGIALEATPQPGGDLPMYLYWSAASFPAGVYSTFVHLVDANGTSWAQDDGPPLGNVFPTTRWWPGEILRDRKTLSLPSSLPDGLYRLDTGIYEPDAGIHLMTPDGRERVPLAFLRIGEPEGPPPDLVPVDAEFGDQLRLLGYALAPAGDGAWTLTLAWTAEGPVEADYTVFVHLVDKESEIWSQHDAAPGGDFYPTSLWRPGETVLDRHDLALPSDSPSGPYHLRVGLYQPETGLRLPAPSGDFVELLEWKSP